MQITINKKKVTLKYSIRALMLYENITGGSFAPKSITDVITFMYCIVVASSDDYTYKLETFINYLDEHPDTFTKFSEWLQGNDAANVALAKKVKN